MKYEASLISRVVDTGDYRSAKALTADHFFSIPGRSAWNFVKKFYLEHNQTPSRDLVEEFVPGFEFEMTSDPVSALVERVHDHFIYNELNTTLIKAGELVQGASVKAAAEHLANQGMRFRALLQDTTSTAVDITQRSQDEIAAYYMRRDLKGVLGLSWPWPRMNRATFGIQESQLIVFYARPKNFKTWLLLRTINHIHYFGGRRIYLVTREMTPVELQRRYCAMYAEIDYDRYLRGELTTMEEIRWQESMDAFSESPPFIIDTVPGVGAEAADNIIQRAQDFGADVIAVDGIYFFGNREWDMIAEFTTRLKYHLLSTLKVPCIGTTQGARTFGMGKKSKDSLDDIGYGDSISQDADLLIKCSYVREDNKIYLSLAGVREGTSCVFQVNARPAYDFTQAYAEEGHEDELSSGGEEPMEVTAG